MRKMVMILPVLAGVLWGSVGIFVRILQNYGMDRWTVLSSKMAIAAVLLFICIFFYNKEWLKIKKKDIWLFLMCGLIGMLCLNICINEAIRLVTLSFTAVLLSLSPIFVILMAAVMFKEKITKRKVACTVAAIIGCAFVSGAFESGLGGENPLLGTVMGLGASFFYAMYGVFSKMTTQRGYNVFTVTLYSTLIAAVAIIPLTDWKMIGDFAMEKPLENISVILFFEICTSILPYVFYTVGLAKGDAGKVSLLAAGGEPAAAMVFGAIFFAEMPTIMNLIGLVITVTALTFICMPDKKQQN